MSEPTMLRGLDVSQYQSPTLIDWRSQDFGIVRLCYGTHIDASAPRHARAIRAANRPVLGGYHFFRATLPVDAQLVALRNAARGIELGVGDMVPWVDVEDYPGHTLVPGDEPALREFVDGAREAFGGVGLYITQRDWGRLGKPAWALELPLWVANYPARGAKAPLARPATPDGRPWRIWQCLVGPLGQRLQDHRHPLAVDQNVARAPLPLIEAPCAVADGPAIPWVTLSDDDWDAMREERDQSVADMV